MSVVYRARDEQLGRDVALKLFRSAVVDHRDDERRRGEVALLAALGHPTLVTLFDARLDAEPAYLTTEYVAGSDLRTRLGSGPVDTDRLLAIGAAVADALAYMHSRGVVHRDVKPGNILLPRDPAPSAPVAKLADFGIARLVDSSRMTATGSVIGTAAYLSPEQARGSGAGPESDLYSLGLVLLECASGHAVFPGSAVESVAARLNGRPVIPAELPETLRSALHDLTAPRAEDRPTAEETIALLAATGERPGAGPGAEVLAPTLVLPSTGDAATERFAAATATTAATALLTRPSAEPIAGQPPAARVTAPDRLARSARSPADPASRRRLAIVGVIAALAILAVVAISVALALPRATVAAPPTTAASAAASPYPSVAGRLGDDLAQLQRSVAP